MRQANGVSAAAGSRQYNRSRMQLWKSTGIVEAFESVEGRAGDLNSVFALSTNGNEPAR